MNTSRISTWLVIAVAAVLSACTVSKTPAPPLQGPSVLGTGLIITASPDVLSMDGASQSVITIEARDSNGQLLPGLLLRVEIVANGQYVDFGSLSARSVVTGSNGRATVTYTAPAGVGGVIPTLEILVTPASTDSHEGFFTARFITIRLIPPGVITGGGPTPSFTVTPAAPTAFTDVRFDASASTAPLGASIVSYSWSFGDGSSATGVSATHRFTSSGTFHVTLTVTDSNGFSASTSKDVVVGTGTGPTADFTFSPQSPAVNQDINFNAGTSKPSSGRSIVRYDWDFGSGSNQSGVTVTKAYDTPGTYNVVLTVTDDAGQTAQVTKSVTVSAGGPTVVITFSPGSPHPGDTVFFNSDGTVYFTGAGPASFAWTFGDGGTSTLANPTHVYSSIGAYTVRLTVTDTKGRTGTTTTTVNVTAVAPPPAPVASFSFSPSSPALGGGASVTVNFDGANSSPQASINNYRWNFGDGTIISGPGGNAAPGGGTFRAPAHAYTSAASFTVTLTVTDTNGQTGFTSQTVTVAP